MHKYYLDECVIVDREEHSHAELAVKTVRDATVSRNQIVKVLILNISI